MSLELALSEISKENQLAIKGSFNEFLEKIQEYSKIIDDLEIKDVDDKESLTKARQARLFLKKERGEAKRLTEKNRSSIKAEKLHFDLLDRAWMESFQFIEGEYKALESKAEGKEKYVQLLEQKRKEEVKANRWKQLSDYMDFEPSGLDIMTDEVFGHVLNGAKSEFEAKIEALKKEEEIRLETERKELLQAKRSDILRPYYDFFETGPKLQEISDEEFDILVSELKAKKQLKYDEDEKVRLENERLKKEREEESDRLKKEAEAREKVELIRKQKEEAERKENEDRQAKLQRDLEAERQKARKEKEERDRKEADRLKKEAESAEAERMAQEELKKAPAKQKIRKALDELILPEMDVDKEAELVYNEIVSKFNGFKSWANSQINKM